MTQPHYIDMEAVALLPCPFCGAGEATSPGRTNGVWPERNDHEDLEHRVMCWSCGCEGKSSCSRDDAIAAWNRRPAPMEAVAWREALTRQCDNMAFILNHAPVGKWYEKFTAELEEDRQALAVIPTQGGGE